MAVARRRRHLRLMGGLAALLIGVGPAVAGEHPTIHHAGVVRSLDLASGVLVLNERAWVGPPVLTRIHVSETTVVIRVRRAGEEFRGERIPLSQLRAGDFLAVRGIDQGDRHHAEVIWSLGPAE